VALFKLEPMAGVGVLDVDTQLGLAIVGRMLGGSGQAGQTPETLSEIEMNLLDDVLMVVLEEWCRVWGVDRRSGVAMVGRESGGRYLQSSASDTVMLVFAFEGALGGYSERIQLAFPFPSLEPTLRNLAAARLPAADPATPKRRAEWRPAFNSIPIPLSVEWDACKISLRDVVGLRPGSVVRVPREILNHTCIRLADVTKFVGEIRIEEERMAIRIDKKISPEDV
jgi:flagellar motor switch protein FliM